MKNTSVVSVTTCQWFLVGLGLSVCLNVAPTWTTNLSPIGSSNTTQAGQPGSILALSTTAIGYLKEGSQDSIKILASKGVPLS